MPMMRRRAQTGTPILARLRRVGTRAAGGAADRTGRRDVPARFSNPGRNVRERTRSHDRVVSK